MYSCLPRDEALEEEDRIDEMRKIKKNSPLVPHLLQGQQAPAIPYAAIVVYDIKVGRCSQLNEYIKLYEYQRSFIDLGPNLSDSIFLNLFSQ